MQLTNPCVEMVFEALFQNHQSTHFSLFVRFLGREFQPRPGIKLSFVMERSNGSLRDYIDAFQARKMKPPLKYCHKLVLAVATARARPRRSSLRAFWADSVSVGTNAAT